MRILTNLFTDFKSIYLKAPGPFDTAFKEFLEILKIRYKTLLCDFGISYQNYQKEGHVCFQSYTETNLRLVLLQEPLFIGKR